MEFRKHVVGSKTIDGKLVQVCRCFFIHPEKENVMGNAQRSFTKAQRRKAIRSHKKYKAKHPFAHSRKRDEFISAIVSSRPRFEVRLKELK